MIGNNFRFVHFASRRIWFEWSRGTGKDGQFYAPFLGCEDCIKIELAKELKKYDDMKNKCLIKIRMKWQKGRIVSHLFGHV